MAGPKILAQVAGSGALVNAYTATSGTVIATIVFAGATATGNAEVRIAKAGAADASSQIVVPAFSVAQGSHFALTEGITLGNTDVVRVNAGTGVNVHLYGTEF